MCIHLPKYPQNYQVLMMYDPLYTANRSQILRSPPDSRREKDYDEHWPWELKDIEVRKCFLAYSITAVYIERRLPNWIKATCTFQHWEIQSSGNSRTIALGH